MHVAGLNVILETRKVAAKTDPEFCDGQYIYRHNLMTDNIRAEYRKIRVIDYRELLDTIKEMVKAFHQQPYNLSQIEIQRDIALQEQKLQAIYSKVEQFQHTPLYEKVCQDHLMDRLLPSKSQSHNNLPTLQDIYSEWCAEKQPSPTAQTEWQSAIRKFNELHEELPIKQITKKHCMAFREALKIVPARLNAKRNFREAVHEYSTRQGDSYNRLSISSVIKYITALSSLLNYAANPERGYIEFNPAANLLPKDMRQGKTRVHFQPDELDKIYHSPIFLDASTKDEKYWILLLALLTGAREEELGQLTVSDIRCEYGINYIDINTNEPFKKVKSTTSIRQIPIHNILIKCGFLAYVEGIKKQGIKMLFPNLKLYEKTGKFTKQFSRWVNEYIDSVGTDDTNKAFHSLRHNFRNSMKESNIPLDFRNHLTGHSSGGKKGNIGIRYEDDRPSLQQLNQYMQQVVFPVRLEHLYTAEA